MARNVTALSIFLASPSDVSEEREIVAGMVDLWNARFGRDQGVIYELRRWETNVASGFGTDGQAVINAQISDYDVFIGLFWTRFGSPTPRAASGTAEEFDIAIERYKSGAIRDIAFLFKDSPVSLAQIDTDQLANLNLFKQKIQSLGVLTKSFDNTEMLQFEISLILDRCAKSGNDSGSHFQSDPAPSIITGDSSSFQQVGKSEVDDNEDVGLFDVIERLGEHAEAATIFNDRLTQHLVEHATVAEEATARLQDLAASNSFSTNDTKLLIEDLALSMDDFSGFLEEETASYGENLVALAGDAREIIRLSYDWIDGNKDFIVTLTQFQETLSQMHLGMTTSYIALDGFLVVLSGLQRTTMRFNKSRRRLLEAGKSLLETLNHGKSLTQQALDEVGRLIQLAKAKRTQQTLE